MKKYIVYTFSSIIILLGTSYYALAAAPPGLGLPNDFFGNSQQSDEDQEQDAGQDQEQDAGQDQGQDADQDQGQNAGQDDSQAQDQSQETSDIKISKLKTTPTKFNPVKGEDIEIIYKVSGESKIEIKIVDEADVEIIKLVDNEDVAAGQEYKIKWNGTDKKDSLGVVTPPGKYFIKATAKNKVDLSVLATKTTKLTIESVKTSAGNKSSSGSASTLHNSPPKETSGTGPETAIYLIFPIVGYLAVRYKKHSRKHSK